MNMRDWLYVEDHCAAIWLVLRAGPRRRDLQRRRPEREAEHRVVDTHLRAARRSRRAPTASSYVALMTYVADRPGHDRRYAIDCSKITRELGWKPAETFATGIAQDRRLVPRPTGWCADITSRQIPRGSASAV